MTAKEKLVNLCDAYSVDTFCEADKYAEGYAMCARDIKSAIKRHVEKLNIFPAFGEDVYKLVLVRKRLSGQYMRKEKTLTSLITSDYELFAAIEGGTIHIEKRPFTKTDLIKFGAYVFETEEEAKAALDDYIRHYGKQKE